MPAAAQAEWSPSQPLRIVVPYTPGGITNIQARRIGQRLSEQLKIPVVVDNKPGASGSIGTELAARMPGDGHTLLLGTQGTIFLNRYLFPAQFQMLDGLIPVHGLTMNPVTLVSNGKRPYKTLAELVAYAHKNPGKVNVAGAGAGTGSYMVFLQVQELAQIETTHVQYKGSAAAINDLVAGVVDVMPDYMVAVQPFVRDGRLNALAVSSSQRLHIAPEVPSMAEAGMPDAELTPWMALFAPAGTPRYAIARLSKEIGTALRHESIDAFIRQGGSVSMADYSYDKISQFLATQGPVWMKLGQKVGLKPA